MRLIFDLDGTLIDSAPDLNTAANRMLAHMFDAPPVPLETFATFIGNGIPKQVTRSLRHAGIDASDEQVEEAIATFKRFFRQAPAEKTIVFPGVRDALAALHADGVKMAVCTNKSEDLAWLTLEQLGMAHYFAALTGGETLPVKKPDPEPLHECARRLGGDDPVLYVGDSETDEQATQAAGYPLILYTQGYRKKPVAEFAAAATFDHFDDLPAVLQRVTA